MAWGKPVPRDLSMRDVLILNSQIEKEERVMVKAYEKDLETKRKEKLRREAKKSRDEEKRRRVRSDRGAQLVEEGRSSSSGRPRRSASSSALSRSTVESERDAPYLPEDLAALKSFPLVDEWLMKVRLHEVDGRKPQLRFEPRRNSAHWVPGSRMYVDYKPVFYLE
ncbi:unnamed protein product [Durusdinium trenchii]|uniref:Uncharacterized protein n=1 Tax=Durusdinium trenchii TaxID=1381693 RepID=A0ABP0K0X7_9DINO